MKRKEFILKSSALVTGTALMPNLIMSNPYNKNSALQVGVIGTGNRGNEIIKIINQVEGISVVACCDVLDFRLAQGVKAVTGKQPYAYSDYRKLLDNKEVDAVIITTPLNTHSQIAVDALKAGKHVYCEKTMAKGIEGTQNLVRAAKESKKTFQVGHQYHASRMYVSLVEMIHDGKIGDVGSIEAQWNRNLNWRRPVPSPEFERQINWRMYREYSYGLLAELSSHQIDFANWVLGDHPQKVVGMGGIDYWKDGRETYDNIHVTYGYKNGVKASYTCLTSNAREGYRIIVKGDKGSLIIYQNEAYFYPEDLGKKITGVVDGYSGATLGWDQVKGIKLNLEHLDPTKQSIIDFKDHILNNTTPLSNIQTGAQVAYAIDMGIRAMDTEKAVYWDPSQMIL